jgi:hypothetical protein
MLAISFQMVLVLRTYFVNTHLLHHQSYNSDESDRLPNTIRVCATTVLFEYVGFSQNM